MTDFGELIGILKDIQPDELYNLAAQSHIQLSFELPEYTMNVDAIGTLRLFEAIRISGLSSKIRVFQASSSELFGKQEAGKPQCETTPFYPRSPYAVAKLFSYWTVINYREAYGIYAVNGILFNHESERRPQYYVTRKITACVARIWSGVDETLSLGNIDSLKDWGHSQDYVQCMWLMLQQEKPDDFVVATGEQHSVREFCEYAFECVGIQLQWRGERGSVEEYGVNADNGKTIVRIDKQFFRPAETANIWGDPSKAEQKLNWKRKITFKDLVKLMVNHDVFLLSSNKKQVSGNS